MKTPLMQDYRYLVKPQYMVHFDGPASGRQYWTVDDKPKEKTLAEKIIENGPKALATAELLTVAFGAGSRNSKSVLALSSRMLKDYGEKSIISAADPKKLAEDFDVPLARAVQIVAYGELGRRFYAKNDASTPMIRNAQDVVSYVGSTMRSLSKEHLRGLYLNAHYKVIHDEVIAIGTVDTSIIHPREVFRPALEYAATAVILVHNHPSGNTVASDADIAITKQLVDAGKIIGIDLVDHVIVTKNSFASVPAHYGK